MAATGREEERHTITPEAQLRLSMRYALIGAMSLEREVDHTRLAEGLGQALWNPGHPLGDTYEIARVRAEGERLAGVAEMFGPELSRIYEDGTFMVQVADYLATDAETRRAIRQVGDQAREAERRRRMGRIGIEREIMASMGDEIVFLGLMAETPDYTFVRRNER